MSTRSCTTIHAASDRSNTSKGFRLAALYRHCDGCPAEAGATLVDTLRNSKTSSDAVALLLADVYELTSKAADHGDLEHEYEAWLAKDGWKIRHGVRKGWDGDEFEWNTYTLAEFVQVVNRDRSEINSRIAQLRSEHPTAYAEATDYPMLALSIGGAS